METLVQFKVLQLSRKSTLCSVCAQCVYVCSVCLRACVCVSVCVMCVCVDDVRVSQAMHKHNWSIVNGIDRYTKQKNGEQQNACCRRSKRHDEAVLIRQDKNQITRREIRIKKRNSGNNDNNYTEETHNRIHQLSE